MIKAKRPLHKAQGCWGEIVKDSYGVRFCIRCKALIDPPKTVFITAYPNIAPANTSITVKGEGSSLQVAIGRAVAQAFKHEKLKGKRIVLPMKIVVTEGSQGSE